MCAEITRPRAFLTAALVVVTLIGCTERGSERLIASAEAYLAQGNPAAAVIQLRNALQRHPEDGSLRLSLGRALLDNRDPAAAEKELRKALEYGQSLDAVLPPLARAMLEQDEPQRLIDEFGARALSGLPAEASFKSTLGDAQLRLGRTAAAAVSFAGSLSALPDNLPAQVGSARLAALEGNPEAALKVANRLVAEHPTAAAPYVLLADLRSLRDDRGGAIAALEDAVRADPRDLAARYALIASFIGDQQLAAAASQLVQARKIARTDLRLDYFEAVIALGNGDPAKARESVQRVLKHSSEHVPSLILAAAIDLQMRQPAAAEAHVRKALALAPQHADARRLLVQIYLASMQPGRALEALQPLVNRDVSTDPTVALLAGETHLANGELRTASSYFTSASRSSGQQAIAHTRLGQIALASGDMQLGFKLLEAVIAAGNAPTHADHSLIAGYVRVNELDRALHAAQRLVSRQPNVPLSRYLLGLVYVARQDSASARDQFNKSLELAPGYLPAVASLSALDIAAGRLADATGRFDALIAREPRNEHALIGLAEVLAKIGADAARITVTLQRAIRANPESVSARLALIDHHLRAAEPQAALAVAQEAHAALPNDNRVLYALAEAQSAAGQLNQAAETFRRWVTLEPRAKVPTMQLAEGALRRNHLHSAVALYRTVIEHEPENFIALNNLAWAAGRIGDPTALNYAQRAVRLAPNNAAALDTLGTLLIAAGESEQAIAHLRKAVALAPQRSDIRLNYAKALIKAGKKGVARSQLEALQASSDSSVAKSEIADMLKTL